MTAVASQRPNTFARCTSNAARYAGHPTELGARNLSYLTTPPKALREVLAACHRQMEPSDSAGRSWIDGWRLATLNVLLDAAQLLPGNSKAHAGRK